MINVVIRNARNVNLRTRPVVSGIQFRRLIAYIFSNTFISGSRMISSNNYFGLINFVRLLNKGYTTVRLKR